MLNPFLALQAQQPYWMGIATLAPMQVHGSSPAMVNHNMLIPRPMDCPNQPTQAGYAGQTELTNNNSPTIT